MQVSGSRLLCSEGSFRSICQAVALKGKRVSQKGYISEERDWSMSVNGQLGYLLNTSPLNPCFGNHTGPCARCRQYCSSPSWPASVWFSFTTSISGIMILILPPITFRLLSGELCRTRCLCLQILVLHVFTQRYALEQGWRGLHTRLGVYFSFSEKSVSEHYTILWAPKLSWQHALGLPAYWECNPDSVFSFCMKSRFWQRHEC